MDLSTPQVNFNSSEELALLIKEAKQYRHPVVVAVECTPARSQILLERNVSNRHPNEADIKGYVRDLAGRHWSNNGDTMKIDHHGNLIDGQKRAMAGIRAGKTFDVFLVLNVKSARDINRPQRETDGDKAKRLGLGFANPNCAAMIGKLIERRERDLFPWDNSFKVTSYELEQRLIKGQAEIQEALDIGVTPFHKARGVLKIHACYGFIAMLLMERTPKSAVREFFQRLCTGAEIPKGSPILTLRRRLEVDKTGKSSGRGAKVLNEQDKCFLIMRTYSAVRKGERLTSLQLPREGVTRENFYSPLKGLR